MNEHVYALSAKYLCLLLPKSYTDNCYLITIPLVWITH